MSNVIDLPAWVPKGPDGSINVDQLRYEYQWQHPTSSYYFGVGIAYGNGYRHLPDANEDAYVAAVLQREDACHWQYFNLSFNVPQ